MKPIPVYLEVGKKRLFASAADWPGWCRSGKDEIGALKALLDATPRYARVMKFENIEFQPPEDLSHFVVTERLAGTATTDFGAPGGIPAADKASIGNQSLELQLVILDACWQAFQKAVHQVEGHSLRKGPRGGGRDLEKILEHVLESGRSYLTRLAWKYQYDKSRSLFDRIQQVQQAGKEALTHAVMNGLPQKGPRGGKIWPPPYFIRRSAWHLLDHTWEIEDRLIV